MAAGEYVTDVSWKYSLDASSPIGFVRLPVQRAAVCAALGLLGHDVSLQGDPSVNCRAYLHCGDQLARWERAWVSR